MSWDISSLTSNSWFTLFLGLITFLSFIGMIYFYYKSKKEKRPLFSMRSTYLLGDLSEKYKPLQVTYDGTKIKNLTVTRIGFWNSGRDTIKKEDIAAKDPLTIKTKNNVQILDIKITTPKNRPNGFEYIRSHDLSSVTFTFDYIDRNQGAVIQLLHTGTSGKDIELTGSIISFGNPEFIYCNSSPTGSGLFNFMLKPIKNKKISRIIGAFFDLIIPSISIIFGVFFFINMLFIYNSFISPFITFLGLLYLIGGITLFTLRFKDLPNKIPTDFDMFYDEEEKK